MGRNLIVLLESESESLSHIESLALGLESSNWNRWNHIESPALGLELYQIIGIAQNCITSSLHLLEHLVWLSAPFAACDLLF